MTALSNGLQVTATGLRTLITENDPRISVFKSMENLYDVTGARMSVHLRKYNNENIEVIINRSCDKCEVFRKFGNEEICDKCSYAKNWLEDGCY